MRLLLTAIPEIAPGSVCGQHVQSPSLTLLLKMFLILQGLHYSSSESALRECHLLCAAGRTVLQIRWKTMQILINHADKTINIPMACSTNYLSLLTEPQLIWSASHHGWSTIQRGFGLAVEKARALCLKHKQPVLSMTPAHSSWARGNTHFPCPWFTEHLLGLLQHSVHLTVTEETAELGALCWQRKSNSKLMYYKCKRWAIPADTS